MTRARFLIAILTACLFSFGQTKAQAPAPLIVKVDQPIAPIQPTMWGIFFEDINMAADGGLYAELVKNRSFEFSLPLMGWKEQPEAGGKGSLLILNRGKEDPDNPRFARITLPSPEGTYGLSNEGFRGMGIKKDDAYHFSILARIPGGGSCGLEVRLVNADGKTVGTGHLTLSGGQWQHFTTQFTATETAPEAHLDLRFEGKGMIDIDMVSLFPQDTWKQRPGGLRADLVQLLADLKPGFIRFPGGCIVEGRDLANRYQWKNTVGDIDHRKLIINRWNTEFSSRSTPDYFQSFGLGFYEYFQLAEDIGAEPLPILNCGMACQYNTAEVVPLEQLDPYIRDALDLIEFANGPVDTKWGGLRASMGHPAPFHLKMLGVGNEQWGPQYIARYALFAKAIKAKYPGIQLVNSVGPSPGGDRFDYLNDTLRALHADLLDEHYYMPPDWFLKNAGRYDHYDRKGSKIFAGEYAAHARGNLDALKKNNWQCALAEAAFMTGLERNAGVVHMASYAPLLARVDGWQWAPDLIWFDNLHAYGTPDYYVQKLYSNNKGTGEVPILLRDAAVEGQDSLYAAACVDANTHELILKIVNTASRPQTREIEIRGVQRLDKKALLSILQNDDLTAVNSLQDPMAIHPVEQEMPVKGKKIELTAAPYSFTVVRIKMR